ncbi:MAG TPA: DUF5700 domain-containing putative Zn-dependent protease [Candidatus Bathyarchaeia archaeon]
MSKSHDIRFDTGALEKIVYEPHWVLDNEEEFWGGYPAQRYTRDWARAVNYEIDYGDWRRRVEEWSRLPEEERRVSSLLRITDTVVGARGRFMRDAVPHILGYLPEATVLDVGVYFIAFIRPRAFAKGEIVFNVAATYWKGNPDNILNTMVHEVFHAGYSYWLGDDEDRSLQEKILRNIHSEGSATYAAYTARHLFPAPDDKDFQMLEDPGTVRKHLSQVNTILRAASEKPEAEVEKMMWDVGVIGRAFYTVGAHMCRVIEEDLGRDALVSTFKSGPAAFTELYNGATTPSLRLNPSPRGTS